MEVKHKPVYHCPHDTGFTESERGSEIWCGVNWIYCASIQLRQAGKLIVVATEFPNDPFGLSHSVYTLHWFFLFSNCCCEDDSSHLHWLRQICLLKLLMCLVASYLRFKLPWQQQLGGLPWNLVQTFMFVSISTRVAVGLLELNNTISSFLNNLFHFVCCK